MNRRRSPNTANRDRPGEPGTQEPNASTRKSKSGFEIVTVDVATGTESVRPWSGIAALSGVALAPDGRSFIASMTADRLLPLQVHRVPFANEATTRLTNDLSGYAEVSVAGDALVTARVETRSSLRVADAGGNGTRQIGSDILLKLGVANDPIFAWAADTHLIYPATLAGGSASGQRT